MVLNGSRQPKRILKFGMIDLNTPVEYILKIDVSYG